MNIPDIRLIPLDHLTSHNVEVVKVCYELCLMLLQSEIMNLSGFVRKQVCLNRPQTCTASIHSRPYVPEDTDHLSGDETKSCIHSLMLVKEHQQGVVGFFFSLTTPR